MRKKPDNRIDIGFGIILGFQEIEEYKIALTFPAGVMDRRIRNREIIDRPFNIDGGAVSCKIIKTPRSCQLSQFKS